MTLASARTVAKARPFLKWAGGKGQLIGEIDARLPKREIEAGQIERYVEPFVGGGAVFFHVAQNLLIAITPSSGMWNRLYGSWRGWRRSF